MELISIAEAAAKGILRLRKPVWACPEDHLKIDIVDGNLGIWTHLYAPFNKECNGRDPVDILRFELDVDSKEYEPYKGALPDSETYKAAVAAYSALTPDNVEAK